MTRVSSAPVSFVHVPSWADFITITLGFRVFGTQVSSTETRPEREVRRDLELCVAAT